VVKRVLLPVITGKKKGKKEKRRKKIKSEDGLVNRRGCALLVGRRVPESVGRSLEKTCADGVLRLGPRSKNGN
jgi:hypothetical protein